MKSGDFDGLTSLEELRLWGNRLTSLPEDIFSGLSSLQTLRFGLNQLTTLPSGLFEGLTSLTDLRMIGNRLTTLPDSIFVGLTGLTRLAMSGNAADPLPIPISLEKIGEGRFKAAAPTGAPFEIVLPLGVSNGSLSDGASSITIPAGSIESAPLTVTRTPSATFAVTVDIGALPGLPANHVGYALVKSDDLPIATTAGNIPAAVALTMTVGAGPGAALRGYNPHSHPDWNFGSLSSRSFVLDGVSYTLHRLRYNVAGKSLEFQTRPMLRGFVLHLDSHQLKSFSAFDYNVHKWVNVNLNWSVGQSIRIGVVEAKPVPPGRPTSLVATPGDKQVTLSWKPPANANPTTLPVTEYEFRVSDDGGSTWEPDWEIIPDSRSGQDNRMSYTVGENDRHNRFYSDGLVNGTTYTLEIRGKGGDGPGAAARATGVPGGATTAATDFNGDGRTDFADFFLFADAYGSTDSRFRSRRQRHRGFRRFLQVYRRVRCVVDSRSVVVESPDGREVGRTRTRFGQPCVLVPGTAVRLRRPRFVKLGNLNGFSFDETKSICRNNCESSVSILTVIAGDMGDSGHGQRPARRRLG